MKINTWILLLILDLSNPFKGTSQNLFKGLEFSFGYGISPQDRRLFDYPQKENVLSKETSRYDHQYDILFKKNFFSKYVYNITVGVGYSLFQTKFGRPFNHNYLTGGLTKELRHIDRYNSHNLKFELTPTFKLIDDGINKFSIILPIDINFTFNKSIKGTVGHYNENKWLFEFRNYEIFSGLKYQNKKISFAISYRFFNYQNIDKVIFYHALFIHPLPSFLNEKDEILNLEKLMFNVGYNF